MAESALDRLACGLGGKTVFPWILTNTPTMMQQSDWKFRHAALMAISAAGEGCHKQMEGYLPQIMDAVMNFVNDPVRHCDWLRSHYLGFTFSNFDHAPPDSVPCTH